jgi:cell division protein FtsL
MLPGILFHSLVLFAIIYLVLVLLILLLALTVMIHGYH